MQTVSATLSVKKENPVLAAWFPRTLAVLLFCAAMLGRSASAQVGQQFVGHIEDPSHASVAGASVTVHNEGTGEDVIVKATGAGEYTVPYMKVGNYTITAEMAGFKTISKTHIHLDTDQTSKIDFTLPVGNITETVTVNSAGSQIELSKADRGEIIDAERVVEMPSNGRNPLLLFQLAPGTVNNHGTGDTSIRPEDNVSQDLYGNGGAVVGAGAEVQENIDGATNDNASGSNAGQYLGYPPAPDSIAEFKVVLNPYDASYGRAGGGAIDITLKSGTNKLHGSLYEFARRPWLDAPTNSYNYKHTLYLQSSAASPTGCPAFPSPANPAPAGCVGDTVYYAHKRDQFGAELDGPVVIPHVYNGKDKTFFTLQWEQAYEDVPDGNPAINSLPDPAWFNGNFNNAKFAYVAQAGGPSGKNRQNLCSHDPLHPDPANTICYVPLGIYDPTLPVVSVVDPNDGGTKTMRQQFAGNNCGDVNPTHTITCLIPQNRINPLVKALQPYYAALTPNYTSGVTSAPYQNNFFYQPVEHDRLENGLLKIDHNFGSRDRGTIRWEGFVRYLFEIGNGIDLTNPANSVLNNIQPKDNNYALEEVHTFSPNLILDNKVVLLNERQNRKYGSLQPGILNTLGFSSNYQNNAFYTNLFPSIVVNGNGNADSGAINLGIGSGNSNPPNSNNIVHTLAYQPSFTLSHGRHTVRGGLDMRFMQFANPGGSTNNNGTLTFDNNFTKAFVSGSDATNTTSGSGFADLVLGYPTGASINFGFDPFYSQHYYGLWAQDDWKVTPKMTLNLGVRWDILGARTERHNRLDYGFDATDVNPADALVTNHAGFSGPLLGGTYVAGVGGNPRSAYKTSWANIQPRFGIAYAFTSRTSLRAGFGEEFINNEDTDSTNGFSSNVSSYTNFLSDQQSGVKTNNTYPAAALPGYGSPQDPFALGYAKPNFKIGANPNLQQQLLLSTIPGSDLSFDNPNYKVPSVWTFSASLEQLLSRRDTLDISYSGNKAFNVTEGLDLNHDPASWSAACDISRGGNHQFCDNGSGPGKVANPFYQNSAFFGTSYYSSSTLGADVYLKPYPLFKSVKENGLNDIHTWYNSMQVTVAHNVSKSLTLHFAYTWSKTFKAGQSVDLTNGVVGRSLSSADTPNVISLSGVFYVPVGRGKALLGNTNRLVDALIGGWEISPLYQFTSGKPTATSNSWQYISPLAVKTQRLVPNIALGDNFYRLQEITPCAAVRVDPDYPGVLDYGPAYIAAGCTAPAAIQQPSYSIGRNVVYSGVRTPAVHQFDASISKHFAWNERANLQLRVDAFNILNHQNFNGGPNTTWNDVNFGTISLNGNPALPNRQLQLSGKITF